MAKNKCQYWNQYEPANCVYWNAQSTKCDYVTLKTEELKKEGEKNPSPPNPSYAPLCNFIGTAVSCNFYKSSDPGEYYPRCILPDPARHVCNRWTGNKWVSAQRDSEGNTTVDFTVINGYNEGACDDMGTDTTCSGYSPQHMGFGRLVPTEDPNIDIHAETWMSKLDEFDLRLPLHFVVYNIRAGLSRCLWWKGEIAPFKINEDTMLVELGGNWICSHPDDTSKYSDFSEETGAPCNGCKPECPYYTGVCWEYCVDPLTQTGDPVLAEQVHELRYYHKEQNWTVKKLENVFIDGGHIYTWKGNFSTDEKSNTDPETGDVTKLQANTLKGRLTYTINNSGFIEEYQIPAIQTEMKDFNVFNVEHKNLVLSKGTTVDGRLTNFPSLVKYLELLDRNPIIKNSFEYDNVFEVSTLGKSKMLVYGKVFYNNEVKAINMSHEEIAAYIPVEVFQYDSMLEAKKDLGEKVFNSFYSRLTSALTMIERTTMDVVARDLLSVQDSTFVVNVPVYFMDELSAPPGKGIHDNVILVYQTTDDGLLYTKIDIRKGLVLGTIVQKEFSVEGDDVPLRKANDYTESLNININKNGKIKFEYFPMEALGYKPEPVHFYNDYSVNQLYSPSQPMPEKPTVYMGHKLYKVVASSYILDDGRDMYAEKNDREYYVLGDDGYVLIQLKDLRVTDVIKPWEFDSIKFYNSDYTECEMEAVYKGSVDGLAPNQMIVKPKDPKKFKSVCSPVIELENLTVYEKYSFDEEPLADNTWKFEIVENENITYNYGKSKAKLSSTQLSRNEPIVLEEFQFNFVPSVLIANRSGRAVTQFRTKLLGWVKQPRCPDVEIKYDWHANYIAWDNYPVCWCCGPWSKRNARPSGNSYSPPCGDHDISMFTKVGPMWWPYVNCESYTTYDIISNLDNFSYDVIGLFKQENEDGKKIHGDHDMRMLGPANNIAWHGRGCNFLLRCTCDWRTYNSEKKGENIFSGWARIRGAVNPADMAKWKTEGEVLPKFGNVSRPHLDSYRTMDKWQYLYKSGEEWAVAWMLMPAAMQFTKVDFTDTSEEPMWETGASQEGPPVVNPLGMLMANSFENSNIHEAINPLARYKFDQVFMCRHLVDMISYPATTGFYTTVRKEGKINSWYEFKQSPTGAGTIQWAWQEKWKPLERLKSAQHSKRIFNKLNNDDDAGLSLNYSQYAKNDVRGLFKFLEVKYPNYKYDYENREFELVTWEDEHTLIFEAPKKDYWTGEYECYIGIKLDKEGPLRGISWEGEWLDWDNLDDRPCDKIDDYNIDLYDVCVGKDEQELPVNGVYETWAKDVTLFDSTNTGKATASAEEADHMIKSYGITADEEEYEKRTYYQRGLDVTVLTSELNSLNLPLRKLPVLSNLAEQNSCDNQYMTLVCGTEDLTSINVSFDEKIKTIGSLDITYKFGAEEITPEAKNQKATYKYYHLPQVLVYAVGSEYELLFESGGMEFYDGDNDNCDVITRTYSWICDFKYIHEGSRNVVIKLRTTPTAEEVGKMSTVLRTKYQTSLNLVDYKVSELYEEILTSANEPIKTWERRYIVSEGGDDAPPQGVNPEEEFTLWPKQDHKSTLYNQDTPDGIMNMPGSEQVGFKTGSKTAGRVLYEIYEDGQGVEGDVHTLEKEQKKLFDRTLSDNTTSAVMEIITPPGLHSYLSSIGVEYMATTGLSFFTNTLLAPLASINSFPPMSGEGHAYEPSEYFKSTCDKQGPCGSMMDANFYYNFVSKDPNADGRYTGIGFSSPFQSYYGGTMTMQLRRDAAKATISNVFGPKYGASSEDKIWAGDAEESGLLFFDLDPAGNETTSAGVAIDYNFQYFAYAQHWHNAYFNTAQNFEGSPSSLA